MATAQSAPDAAQAGLRPDQRDVEAARQAGAEAANLVIRMQMDAGMPPERMRASAERVLADRFADPSPASDAFYAAYDETSATLVADMPDPAAEPGGVEAG